MQDASWLISSEAYQTKVKNLLNHVYALESITPQATRFWKRTRILREEYAYDESMQTQKSIDSRIHGESKHQQIPRF